jgi:hypothetical protein
MSIEPGALVIVHCQNPKEKLWGELQKLDALGAVLRALDLLSVEDWLGQQRRGDEGEIGIAPTTLFVPMHRIERVYLDESNEMTMSFGDRYASTCGGDVRDALRGRRPEGGGAKPT